MADLETEVDRFMKKTAAKYKDPMLCTHEELVSHNAGFEKVMIARVTQSGVNWCQLGKIGVRIPSRVMQLHSRLHMWKLKTGVVVSRRPVESIVYGTFLFPYILSGAGV